MPVQQDAHLLTTTALAQVSALDLRETTGTLWGDRFAARRLGSAAGGRRRHTLVAG